MNLIFPRRSYEDHLATEFAQIIEMVREEKWDAFSEAALQCGLTPYVALARMLVRMTEDELHTRKRTRRNKRSNA